jgi:hypothetical protein
VHLYSAGKLEDKDVLVVFIQSRNHIRSHVQVNRFLERFSFCIPFKTMADIEVCSVNEYDYLGGLNIIDWLTHQMSHLAKTLYNSLVVLFQERLQGLKYAPVQFMYIGSLKD